MTFGYFVAWQNPALRAYYGGTDPGSFVASMRQNWVKTPWIFPLQFGRGILWALFLVPLIRRSHLVETLGSNLIFGFGVGWLLSHPGAMKTPSPSL
jgi:hypothetical protein